VRKKCIFALGAGRRRDGERHSDDYEREQGVVFEHFGKV